MTVSVRFAQTTLGEPLSLPVDAEDLAPGDQSNVFDFYISHTGTAKISSCKLYILPYSSGVYHGTRTAQDDFDAVVGWGDASYPAVSGGGFYINFNHSGGFPLTDYGDSLAAAINLPAVAINIGGVVAGEIQAAGEAHIRCRIDVPAGYVGDTGVFYFDLLMYYVATS
jgi:hypothetical protein